MRIEINVEIKGNGNNSIRGGKECIDQSVVKSLHNLENRAGTNLR